MSTRDHDPSARTDRTGVLVLGMHRSGTSALTRVLGLLGAGLPSDPMPPVAGDNRLGFWESSALVTDHNRLLAALQARWDTPLRADPDPKSELVSGWIETISTHLREHFADELVVALKDPRLCRLVPVWLEVLAREQRRAVAVLPVRHPLEVAASLQARNGFASGQSLWLWADHVLRAERATRELPRYWVRYTDLLDDWQPILQRVNETLRLGLHIEAGAEAVSGFLSARHRHHTAAADAALPEPIEALYAVVNTAAARGQQPEPAEMDRIAAAFAAHAELTSPWLHRLESKLHDAARTQSVVQDRAAELESQLAAADAVRQQLEHQAQAQSEALQRAEDARMQAAAALDHAEQQQAGTETQLQHTRDELAAATQQAAAIAEQRRVTQAALEVAEHEIDQLQRELAERDRALAAAAQHAERVESQADALQAELAETTATSERTAAQLHTTAERLQASKEAHAADAARAQQAQARATRTQQALEQQLEASKQRLETQQRHARALAAEIERVTQSRSWKLTAPARAAVDVFRVPADNRFSDAVLARRVRLVARLTRYAISPKIGPLRTAAIVRTALRPDFNATAYQLANPDVAQSGLNPAEHYVLFGRRENRALDTATSQIPQPAIAPITPPSQNGTSPRSNGTALCLPSPVALVARAPNAADVAQARQRTAATCKSFSIVMPTWNRADTIGRAIETVLEQSYPHWQLIVVDDGSTDGTVDMLQQRYAAEIKAGRLQVLRGEHQGVSAARNLGLRAATGDWVAYLDSDNTWHPDHLLLVAAGYAQQPARRTAYAALRVHDRVKGTEYVRATPFDWNKLAQQNYIDLNVFSHDRELLSELGGFDQSLTRLVDWDLIVRYTRDHPPIVHETILADYYLDKQLKNITHTEPLASNRAAVLQRSLPERIRRGAVPLRLAYVLWDYPALSQTFVLREIEWMAEQGVDVRVYYAAEPDRAGPAPAGVIAQRVASAEELAEKLAEDKRNWAHTHFVYPAATKLLHPACEAAGIPFSVMPHAVDIFHHANRERNRAAEIGKSPFCQRFVVYGDHHREFLIDQSVPVNKFVHALQASDAGRLAAPAALPVREPARPLRLVSIGRLIEKKGFGDLLEAIRILKREGVQVELDLYGYGPLQDELQAFCRKHGLEGVRFRGTFEGAEALQQAFAEHDAFVLPCCVAANGDVDGFPTVFMEAAAFGLPIVTTTASAIPDYLADGANALLVPENDPAALAQALQRLHHAPDHDRAALAGRAHEWAHRMTGSDRIGQTLLDVMARPPLEIFMVTHFSAKYGDWDATARAIQSVLQHTSTPYRLTIVDNASDAEHLGKLRELAAAHPGTIRLLPLESNEFCGGASNRALELAESEFVIYLCSNEGLALRHGWERELIETMRANPKAALGGQLVHSPKWATGADLARHQEFVHFRNPEFARAHAARTFRHVQGGTWILRKSAHDRFGGFNPAIPQAGMDVEYSYYLESRGCELLDIAAVVSVSNKTLPRLDAQLCDNTAVAHPVLPPSLELANACNDPHTRRCNLCGWLGSAAELEHAQSEALDARFAFVCPACQATAANRAAWAWLARSAHCYRGQRLGVVLEASGHPDGLTEHVLEVASPAFASVHALNTVQDETASRCDVILASSACGLSVVGPNGPEPVRLDQLSTMLGTGTRAVWAWHRTHSAALLEAKTGSPAHATTVP